MRKLKFLVILVAAFALSVVGVLGQEAPFDNDPATNPDANACYEGGSMEDKCNDDMNGDGVVTQNEIDWAWNCGWYLIRYENNMGGLPADCVSLLDGQFEAIARCIFDPLFEQFVYYTGNPTEERNVFYFPEDPCIGDAQSFGDTAIVQTDNIEDAAMLCGEVLGGSGIFDQIYQYPGEEEDLWICLRIT